MVIAGLKLFGIEAMIAFRIACGAVGLWLLAKTISLRVTAMDTLDGKLLVFEEFRRDPSLPKWQDKRKQSQISVISESESDNTSVIAPPFRGSSMVVARQNPGWGRRSMLERFVLWLIEKLKRTPALRREMTVQQVFASMKDSVEQITVVNERAAGYATLLSQAKQTGQTALYEQLLANLDAVRSETQLLAIGMTKTISEDNVIALSKKAPRDIRIDWVENFTRPIPADIIEKKRDCDERRIFDNYVVMHYDPKKKNSELTKVQAAAKRDPVLFGVLEGSRKLYFVGDWIDEQCDLTLDKVAELLGKDAVLMLETQSAVVKR